MSIARYIILLSIMMPIEHPAAQEVMANYDPQNKFDIRIAGVWGGTRMSDLNEHTRVFYGKEINADYQFNVEFGYFLSPKASVNIGFVYIQSKRLKPDGNYDLEDGRDYSISASMKSPYYLFRYFFPMKNVDYYVSCGQALCFGNMDYYYQIPGFHTYNSGNSYTAVGIGVLTSAGAYYRISEFFSVGAEIGYRYLSTGDLQNQGGDTISTTGRNSGVNLDFSGFYISGGISFRL